MECEGCTLCCTLFLVKWLKKPVNTVCKYCDGAGCMIHETKDRECKEFDCMYAQAGKDIKFRPDKCHMIFEKVAEQLIVGTRNVGFKFSDVAEKQVAFFTRQGYSILLVGSDFRKPQLLLDKGHDEAKIFEQINKRWQYMEQI